MLVARTLRAILRTDAAALLQRLESDEPVSSGDMCGVQELEKTRNGIRLRLVNKLAAADALLKLCRESQGQQDAQTLLAQLRDGG